MLWHAMPPEVNTARLMAGAGPAPMMQAAAGWEQLGMALERQADELAMILSSLSTSWTGGSSERAIAAATPMVAWLKTVAAQSHKRGMQAAAQAAAYTTAMAMTPSLPEIAANHITRAVLAATNFLGINMVPIALKETDYFVRMWNQAAGAMDAYQAQTATNTVFEPVAPMKPIVMPVGGQAAEAGAMTTLAAMASKAADPGALAALTPELPAPVPRPGLTLGEQVMPLLTQLGQLSGPMQQLTQLVQQVGSMGGLGSDQVGGLEEEDRPQLGLLGASPLSTHPLAGGSGPSGGAGLMRADSLPGAGGSSPRMPMLAQLLDTPVGSVAPAAVTTANASGAGSSAAGGAAPMGGMPGHGASSGGARAAMPMPALLAPAPVDDDRDDVNDEDDW